MPNPGDPQSLNRYSYALNNPLRYRDPTGHRVCDGEFGCRGEQGHIDFWYGVPTPTLQRDLHAGGDYDYGQVRWGKENVSVYIPPFESAERSQGAGPVFVAAPGYYLTHESFRNACVAPGAKHWQEAYSTTTKGMDLARSFYGGLAGMNGSQADESLAPSPVALNPQAAWSRPKAAYVQQELTVSLLGNIGSSMSGATNAGAGEYDLYLQKNSQEEFRVVVVRDPVSDNFLAGMPSFVGYGQYVPIAGNVYP